MIGLAILLSVLLNIYLAYKYVEAKEAYVELAEEISFLGLDEDDYEFKL